MCHDLMTKAIFGVDEALVQRVDWESGNRSSGSTDCVVGISQTMRICRGKCWAKGSLLGLLDGDVGWTPGFGV